MEDREDGRNGSSGSIRSRPQALMVVDQRMRGANHTPAVRGRLPFGIAFRNLVTRLLQFPLVADFFFGREPRGEIKLPDYGF